MHTTRWQAPSLSPPPPGANPPPNNEPDVENFPGFPEGILGVELTGRMREQSEKCGTKIFTETVTQVDLSKRPFKVGGAGGAGRSGVGERRGQGGRAIGGQSRVDKRACRGDVGRRRSMLVSCTWVSRCST